MPFPEPGYESAPAADVKVEASGDLHFQTSLPVHKPTDEDDFVIQMQASKLKRVRTWLAQIEDEPSWYVAASNHLGYLLAGGTIGAFVSGLSLTNSGAVSWAAIVLYFIFPLVAVALLVFHYTRAHYEHDSSNKLAKQALSELPDPEKTDKVKAK